MTQEELLLAEQIYTMIKEKYVKQQISKLIPVVPGVYIVLEPRIGRTSGRNLDYLIQTFHGDMNRLRADGYGIRITPDLIARAYLKKHNYRNEYIGTEFFFEHLFTFFNSKDEIELFVHELMIELI
jgi:hypothetical protein